MLKTRFKKIYYRIINKIKEKIKNKTKTRFKKIYHRIINNKIREDKEQD